MDYFHHVTHIDNFEKILISGLKSRSNVKVFKDTANIEIVGKRNSLNNYVPFHLDAIQKTHGISYNKAIKDHYGEDNLVFFIVKMDSSLVNYFNPMKFFVFHPICNWKIECTSYDSFINTLNEKYKKLPYNSYGPDYRKQEVQEFFMSELLIRDEVFLNSIEKLVVLTNTAKSIVEKICLKNGKNILIEVNSSYAK